MNVGSGQFRYRHVDGWGRGATGVADFGQAVGIAVDSADHIHVATRHPTPQILVFDRAGALLTTWGEDVFVVQGGIHSIWIGKEDQIICVDALDHTVRRFTPDRKLVAQLGTPGQPASQGQPFNMPTKAVLSPAGDYWVSDGYGHEWVHHFSPDGDLIQSWGGKGTDPGQFDTPHSICLDTRGRVVVADRANHRLQFFDPVGKLLDIWNDVRFPMDLWDDGSGHLYVVEGEQRMSVFDLDGTLLSRWGETGAAPGQFADMPHAMAIDSRGDLYICEVVAPNLFHKYERI